MYSLKRSILFCNAIVKLAVETIHASSLSKGVFSVYTEFSKKVFLNKYLSFIHIFENVCSKFLVDLLSPNTSYNMYNELPNSPKLSLQFPCKQVGRIWFSIFDKLLFITNWFILITKQLILNRLGLQGVKAVLSRLNQWILSFSQVDRLLCYLSNDFWKEILT